MPYYIFHLSLPEIIIQAMTNEKCNMAYGKCLLQNKRILGRGKPTPTINIKYRPAELFGHMAHGPRFRNEREGDELNGAEFAGRRILGVRRVRRLERDGLFSRVAFERLGRNRRGIEQRIIQLELRRVSEQMFDVIQGGHPVGFVELGHRVANVNLLRLRPGESFGDAADEQVGYDTGEERPRAERDQVGVEYGLDRFV